jgi:hypothetical protein
MQFIMSAEEMQSELRTHRHLGYTTALDELQMGVQRQQAQGVEVTADTVLELVQFLRENVPPEASDPGREPASGVSE